VESRERDDRRRWDASGSRFASEIVALTILRQRLTKIKPKCAEEKLFQWKVRKYQFLMNDAIPKIPHPLFPLPQGAKEISPEIDLSDR
jgi:hypothetical protein